MISSLKIKIFSIIEMDKLNIISLPSKIHYSLIFFIVLFLFIILIYLIKNKDNKENKESENKDCNCGQIDFNELINDEENKNN